MRTPWREALDGKIRVMRDLRSDISANVMENYFAESASLRRLVGPSRLRDAALHLAVKYADSTRLGVQRSEPFWVWDEIVEQVDQKMRVGEKTTSVQPFRMTDLPVPEGLIWFQRPHSLMFESGSTSTARVRAIFFGEARSALTEAKPGERVQFSERFDELGVVAFLEGVGLFTPDLRSNTGQLIPWICNALADEQNLHEYRSAVRRNTPDISVEEFLMSTWPVAFCVEFFRLLQQRQLRYGGSGVEREARKEARRHSIESTVQVVEWRKAEYKYPAGYGPKFVAWSCRWPSREHTRRLKSGKVVRVAASIKGPKDKPLKLGRERVNVVKH